jgi:hypothetical protein
MAEAFKLSTHVAHVPVFGDGSLSENTGNHNCQNHNNKDK